MSDLAIGIMDWYTFIGSQLFLVSLGYILRGWFKAGVKKVETQIAE